ncbi:MAG TPA: hypothetical protein VJH97_01820 [Candidatus Nanoarchaeia archaeon]|nr:hypothetical protein [Candidatus Nanoarchaeia archaeon]
MSYENPYGVGSEVLHELNYNVLSHGDLGATYDSLVNADLPIYTSRFYSPTEHEQIADVKYKKIEIGYIKDMKEMVDAFDGPPLEAYLPVMLGTSDTGSSGAPVVRPADIVIKDPAKEVVAEIVRAQREAAGRELIIKELDIEEIIIRRRIRKREVKIINPDSFDQS